MRMTSRIAPLAPFWACALTALVLSPVTAKQRFPMAGTRRALRIARACSTAANISPARESEEIRHSARCGVTKEVFAARIASIEVSTHASTAMLSAPNLPRKAFITPVVTTSRHSSMIPSCSPRQSALATAEVLSMPGTGSPIESQSITISRMALIRSRSRMERI